LEWSGTNEALTISIFRSAPMFTTDTAGAGFIQDWTVMEEEAERFRIAAESEPPATLG